MEVYIYGLYCPLAGAIRYVGKSIDPNVRLRGHIKSSKQEDSHKARWIRTLTSRGLSPRLIILHKVQAGERWQDIERGFISRAAEFGWRLTNATAGGEGLDFIDPSAQAAFRARHKQAMKDFSATPAGREVVRKMRKGLVSEEVQSRRKLAIKAAYSKPEVVERAAQINSEINGRPRVRFLKELASRANWDRADYREKIRLGWVSSGALDAQRDRLSERWSDDCERERLISARWTDEARQAQSLRITNRNKKPIDPEVLKRRNAAIKASWAQRKQISV